MGARAGFDGQTRDFYLRQLRDWKGSAEIETMVPTRMRAYGELCGRSRPTSAQGAFDRAIGAFASAYAGQNERDHSALVEAIRSDRLEAQSGLYRSACAARERCTFLRLDRPKWMKRWCAAGMSLVRSYGTANGVAAEPVSELNCDVNGCSRSGAGSVVLQRSPTTGQPALKPNSPRGL